MRWCGSNSVIKQNVLPFSVTATVHNAEVYGANKIGLERKGYSSDAIEPLQNAFRILSRSGLNTTQALGRIEQELPQTSEIKELLDFIRRSQGGFIK